MKKQVLFSVLTMVLLMASGAANAQLGSNGEVRFNVPFDYKVGNATMKAGDCSIHRVDIAENDLAIRCNGSTALVLAGTVSGKVASETKLVFDKYGDQYLLAQIWVRGGDWRAIAQNPEREGVDEQGSTRFRGHPGSQVTKVEI